MENQLHQEVFEFYAITTAKIHPTKLRVGSNSTAYPLIRCVPLRVVLIQIFPLMQCRSLLDSFVNSAQKLLGQDICTDTSRAGAQHGTF